MIPARLTPHQIPLDLGHRTAMGRDDFLISPANEDAVAWIDRWPDWPAPALILYGPPACGKSHLAAVWQERSCARRVAAGDLRKHSAEDLTAGTQPLLIDPFDAVPGDRAAEAAAFHIYNILREQGRTMLLTLTIAPVRTDFVIPDLASRLRAAPAVSISAPDDALLAAVLVKLFADRQIAVGQDVLAYALARMERSFAAARDLADAADRLALAEKRPVSVPLIRQVLEASANSGEGGNAGDE